MSLQDIREVEKTIKIDGNDYVFRYDNNAYAVLQEETTKKVVIDGKQDEEFVSPHDLLQLMASGETYKILRNPKLVINIIYAGLRSYHSTVDKKTIGTWHLGDTFAMEILPEVMRGLLAPENFTSFKTAYQEMMKEMQATALEKIEQTAGMIGQSSTTLQESNSDSRTAISGDQHQDESTHSSPKKASSTGSNMEEEKS